MLPNYEGEAFKTRIKCIVDQSLFMTAYELVAFLLKHEVFEITKEKKEQMIDEEEPRSIEMEVLNWWIIDEALYNLLEAHGNSTLATGQGLHFWAQYHGNSLYEYPELREAWVGWLLDVDPGGKLHSDFWI